MNLGEEVYSPDQGTNGIRIITFFKRTCIAIQWVYKIYFIVLSNSSSNSIFSCADPESFVRGDPTHL